MANPNLQTDESAGHVGTGWLGRRGRSMLLKAAAAPARIAASRLKFNTLGFIRGSLHFSRLSAALVLALIISTGSAQSVRAQSHTRAEFIVGPAHGGGGGQRYFDRSSVTSALTVLTPILQARSSAVMVGLGVALAGSLDGGLDDFIDAPIRTYSSGMGARLGFIELGPHRSSGAAGFNVGAEIQNSGQALGVVQGTMAATAPPVAAHSIADDTSAVVLLKNL